MIENKAILIDTCIVRNLLSKEKPLREKTEYLLSELRKSDNELYVSEYSYKFAIKNEYYFKFIHPQLQMDLTISGVFS